MTRRDETVIVTYGGLAGTPRRERVRLLLELALLPLAVVSWAIDVARANLPGGK